MVSGVFGLVNVVAIVLLLNWKKNGFVLLVISSLVNASLAVILSTIPWGIIGLIIWYLILQLKKNGKTCWEQLS